MNQASDDNHLPRRKKKKFYKEVSYENEGELACRRLPVDNRPCDCCRTNCLGCFYPCETCGSVKCGVQCRVGRTWMYENIIIQKK